VDLSIIIPARNEELRLPEQLDALAAQEWSGEWEVLVVDNGSTDGTADLVRSAGEVDSRVRLVSAADRPGLNYTRNVGLEAASGVSVALCDADDVVAPGWVAAMGEALADHEMVTGALELDRLNPRWLADSRGRGHESQLPTFHGIFSWAHGNNIGLRRETLEGLGGFDEEVLIGSDDVELSLRAWQAGIDLEFVPDAIVHYRYRSDAADLWRQGRNYGRSRPLVLARLRQDGLPTPSPVAGWRSWLWLVANLHRLRTPEGRASWTWVAGNRLGHLEGSIRYRTLFL
jgi:glycosyltransferase involved in cell wall biosynthesis